MLLRIAHEYLMFTPILFLMWHAFKESLFSGTRTSVSEWRSIDELNDRCSPDQSI